jgi:hypothetical protein
MTKKVSLLFALLALGAWAACNLNLKPKGRRAEAARAGGAPLPDLPDLAKPEPLPAERVVHLLYTTNNDGEVEPCG